MKMALARLKPFADDVWRRVRHPTRRGIALTVAALPVLVLLYVLVLIPFTPSIKDLRKAKFEKPAVVLSADGKELAVFKRSNRDWVKLADISPNVVNALIATEDHRFYQHHGIDLKRTASAAMHTFSGDLQGGSTITQQLARNLYPNRVGRAQTLTRKIKEAITALKIEAVYSKQEILETYLNTVPFLYNAYGIEMAARTYFDQSADELDLLQSATLVGMLKGSSYYNPVLNPERSLQRRNTVLEQMVKRDKLAAAKLPALKKKPLGVDFERQSEPLGPAPHFTQFLRRWLIDWADRNGYNLYADGLVIHTTIDSRLQKFANQAVARQTNRLQGVANGQWGPRAWAARKDLVRAFVRETAEYKAARGAGQTDEQAQKQLLADRDFMRTLRENKTRLQAGFLALDPSNGHVMAWVGSRDFSLDPFDHVQQARRQPGSTFKPFVYGAAFEKGASPSDTFMDQAIAIPLGGGAFWRPTDGNPPSGLPMTLRDGLAYSNNIITAQVMQDVGPARVAKLAKAMGVRQSKLEEVPSLALGTSPVTLKEMVASYSTLANSGSYIEPILVTRIEDRNGKVLAQFHHKPPEQAMPVAVAHTLVDVMRGVIDRGTGAAIRGSYGIRADVAGKTGTTQDNTDGWFILMHQQLVAGAWVGFNDNRIRLQGNYWGQGAHSALPIVGDFFQQSLRARLIDQGAKFAGVAPPVRPAEPEAQLVQPEQSEPIEPTEQPIQSGTDARTPDQQLFAPNAPGGDPLAPFPHVLPAMPAAPPVDRPPPLPPILRDMFAPDPKPSARPEPVV